MVRIIMLVIFTISMLGAQNIVINEIFYNPDGADGGYEWLELYNPSSNSINLNDWQILRAGKEFEVIYTFSDLIIPAQAHLLIGEEMVQNCDIYTSLSFQNGGNATDGIRISSADGSYYDTVLYDQPNTNNLPDDIYDPATHFAINVNSGNSLARFSDGIDSNNSQNDWFESYFPTPGTTNFYPIDLEIVSQDIYKIGDIHWLSTQISNLSTKHVDNLEAEFQIAINSNQLVACELPEIPAETTIQFNYKLGLFEDGYYLTRATVKLNNDNNLVNNIHESAFLVGKSPIVINEVLYKNSGVTSEWVEIFNRGSCVYNVDNFVLKDESGGEVSLSCTIYPQEYLIVANDANQVINSFPSLSPEKVFQPENWTALNNLGDKLILSDQFHTVFDSLEYQDHACPTDVSIERVNPFSDENITWQHSVAELGATPTLANSLLPSNKDLALKVLEYKIEQNRLSHRLLIYNQGIEPINSADFLCKYNDEVILEEQIELMDSLIVEFETTLPANGYYEISYELYAEEDNVQTNNFAYKFYNNNSLPFVINEIMYSPENDEPEWIELKINQYQENLSTIYLIINEDTLYVPNKNCEYLLITANVEDSLFLKENYNLDEIPIFCNLTSLSNSGEYLELGDVSGNLIEAFSFDPNWNNEVKGVSLERVNPHLMTNSSNWDMCVDRCTPGRKNSIWIESIPVDSKISISPNPFSPYLGQHTIINFQLSDIISKCTMRVYDLKGRLRRKIIDQEFYSSENSIIFDGRDSVGKILPIGIYVVLLEAVTNEDDRVIRLQETVVIAK
ncbi:MAG: lamin tail domain-containing protein [Candidatus Cloacimonetes bacterium]|nr:lamin tail domain-containing protein [Candidatus Cloacimonadota bacterium]